jgi:hypothetical protein
VCRGQGCKWEGRAGTKKGKEFSLKVTVSQIFLPLVLFVVKSILATDLEPKILLYEA